MEMVKDMHSIRTMLTIHFGSLTLPASTCASQSIAPKFLPTASHPCLPKNGTYLGLTWDLLGTCTPLRADGIVSVTLFESRHKGTAPPARKK